MSDAPARRICVICNEGSGRNSREAQAIETAMEVLGEGAELRQVRGEDLDDAAREAVAQDFDTVVAAGGDGTIMTVAGQVMDTGRRFGVLPMGTLFEWLELVFFDAVAIRLRERTGQTLDTIRARHTNLE